MDEYQALKAGQLLPQRRSHLLSPVHPWTLASRSLREPRCPILTLECLKINQLQHPPHDALDEYGPSLGDDDAKPYVKRGYLPAYQPRLRLSRITFSLPAHRQLP